ncbi:MAG: DUF4145 domain-containing protein [Lachnospiraceae bacterium]|nr:DUF4145 domain-containing protein [Lachnospiraceae bacterium]
MKSYSDMKISGNSAKSSSGSRAKDGSGSRFENRFINSYEFTTPYGEKCFELYQGDLIQFDEPIDVLIVSSFQSDYEPFRGTLIGALWEQLDISVKRLSQKPFIDLREEKGIWVSQKLQNGPFQYLMCVEFLKFYAAPTEPALLDQRLQSMFSCLQLLQSFSPSICTAAMPLIGTGDQQISPSAILSILFQHGATSLPHCTNLQKIYIIERTKDKISEISAAMDQVLGRKGQQIVNVFRDLESLETLENIQKLIISLVHVRKNLRKNKTISRLVECISQQEARYLDIAILSRRIIELMLKEINPASQKKSLYKQIQDFGSKNIAANWIISYMHIVRILGNEQAHEDLNQGKLPCEIMVTDQRIMLHCLEQLFNFWIEYEHSGNHHRLPQ